MGEVVALGTGGSSRRPMAAGEEAQILLFTGVRYLRIEAVEPPQDAGTPTPRAPRRRRAKRQA